MEKSCCFTGHRPKYFHFGTNETHPDCVKIKDFIRERCEYLIADHGVTHFISGGAMGVDTWAMETIVRLKKKHPITLECALPYADMPYRFAPEDAKRYAALVPKIDTITALNDKYHSNCMNQRNQYMVDNAAFLIAIWTGIMSGTGRTVRYAEKQGRTVFRFNPDSLLKY